MKNKRFSFRRFLFESMEIVFMPRSFGAVRFSFRPLFALILFLLWLAVTVWAACLAFERIDYSVSKAENKVMKAKLAMIAEELSRNRKYIKLARKTDREMRSMLGMSDGNYINLPSGLAQGREERAVNFKEMFSRKAQDIDEKELNSFLGGNTEDAQKTLAGFQEIAWFYANQKNVSDATPSIPPTQNARITSGFGYRLSPFGTHIASYHYGLDFAGKPNSKIMATAEGVVRQTGWASTYGQAVLIDHGFGYSTLYGHLADIRVKRGDKVKRGQIIANMGTTGRSTGVHLHYEVWKDGTPVNPRGYLKEKDLKP